MVAVALAPGKVGIDCEIKGRNRNWLGIANQFFTAREARVIATASPKQRESVFLRHWVLKEAWIKACRGSVLSDLNRLVIEGPDSVRIKNCTLVAHWRAWQLELCGCPVAVCSASRAPLLIYRVNRLLPAAVDNVAQPAGASPIEQDSLAASLVTETKVMI